MECQAGLWMHGWMGGWCCYIQAGLYNEMMYVCVTDMLVHEWLDGWNDA